ncbi:MAG: TrbI/VirB10 family protein [Methylocystis sp.]|nr:TrbI/VirB10 family protein [Methylocystis sp.]
MSEKDAHPADRDIGEELRLRPERPKVKRLSRQVLIGLGAVSSAALLAALFFALESGRNRSGATTELLETEHKTLADGLAGLPHDYGGLPKPLAPDVPKLGPPLPGDLGRPILAAQGVPGIDAAEQKIAQESEAARTSKLFIGAGVRAQPSAVTQPAAFESIGSSSPGAAITPERAPTESEAHNAQDRKLAFLNAPVDKRTTSLDRLERPASSYVVQAGTIIPGALITGIRSDLPGQITAQVTQHVYDSPTGRFLLIPQGSKLVGVYDSQVTFGQQRTLLVWTRLILPNGKSIVLERQPGADAQGYSGLEDEVDNHWGSLVKAALLTTILGVGSDLGSNANESDIVRALRRGAQDSTSQTGQQIVRRSLDIQPTLTIRPGFPVNVIVTRDLVLAPYAG